MNLTNGLAPLIQYLLDNELTETEAMLLYTVYIRTEAPENKELLKLLTKYYDRFHFYDQKNEPIGIPWSTIVQKLERDGFLICYDGYTRKGAEGIIRLDTSRLEVTDKFKQTIIYADKDRMGEYCVAEIYGTDLWVNGQRTATILPDQGEDMDMLKNRFWKLCGNGLRVKIQEFFETTTEILDGHGPTMKITKYLKAYDGLVMDLKIRKHKESIANMGSY